MNKYTDIDGTMPSVHAEMDAILRLPYLHKRKKLVKVNLLVLLTNPLGHMDLQICKDLLTTKYY